MSALRQLIADKFPPPEQWPAMVATYAVLAAGFAAVIAAKLP